MTDYTMREDPSSGMTILWETNLDDIVIHIDYNCGRGPSGMTTLWEGTQWDDYTVGGDPVG